jgi:hypothetical protein
VVCGLWVVPAARPDAPWAVSVCPGYAVGPYGDEILVPERTSVDVRDFLWTRPAGMEGTGGHALVAVRPAEEFVRPVAARPPGCGCEDPVYLPSRVRESFRVDVVWQFSDPREQEPFDVCAPRLVACPECPEGPYVSLACITLPASDADPITAARIDNWTCRRSV